MKSQAKVKSIILLAIIVLIALFGVIGFQLYKIFEAEKQIASQQQTITSLQQQIDEHSKTPDSEFETITGENQ